MRRILIIAAAFALLSSCSGKQDASFKDALAQALAANDLARINSAVEEARRILGDKAGVPEVADEFRVLPSGATMLTRDEAQRGFAPHFDRLQKLRWWRIGMDPTKITAPLREVASVITGNVAVARAKLDGAEPSLAMAKDSADFLIWAQEQAGAGCFPFPAARGTSNARAMEVATRFLQKAEKAGKLGDIVHNGWTTDDLGEGGMQFDNGECGVAMFELHEITKDARHLASARKAADWALARPLCANWNYNSFSVRLLARAFVATGDAKYLDAAVQKARLGVIPGQLRDGPHAGRWMDAHNARPTYHYVMMAALGELAAAIPATHEHRAEIVQSLKLGLTARNSEMTARGVMNKDSATDALLLVTRVFASDADFLHETKSADAMHALALLISDEAHHGKLPLSPGNWGLFLDRIKREAP